MYCTLLGPLSTHQDYASSGTGSRPSVTGSWWDQGAASSSFQHVHPAEGQCWLWWVCMLSYRMGEQLAPTPASLPASHQRVRTHVCGAEGTHADTAALRMPCPVKGAACPACPGSQSSSPPAHPSLPLWALQPPGLRAEGADSFPGGRFLSSGAVNYPRPVAHNLSVSPLSCLPGCRHSTCPVCWLHQGPASAHHVHPCSFTGCKTPAALKHDQALAM